MNNLIFYFLKLFSNLKPHYFANFNFLFPQYLYQLCFYLFIRCMIMMTECKIIDFINLLLILSRLDRLIVFPNLRYYLIILLRFYLILINSTHLNQGFTILYYKVLEV